MIPIRRFNTKILVCYENFCACFSWSRIISRKSLLKNYDLGSNFTRWHSNGSSPAPFLWTRRTELLSTSLQSWSRCSCGSDWSFGWCVDGIQLSQKAWTQTQKLCFNKQNCVSMFITMCCVKARSGKILESDWLMQAFGHYTLATPLWFRHVVWWQREGGKSKWTYM